MNQAENPIPSSPKVLETARQMGKTAVIQATLERFRGWATQVQPCIQPEKTVPHKRLDEWASPWMQRVEARALASQPVCTGVDVAALPDRSADFMADWLAFQAREREEAKAAAQWVSDKMQEVLMEAIMNYSPPSTATLSYPGAWPPPVWLEFPR